MMAERVEAFLALLASYGGERAQAQASGACSSSDVWIPTEDVQEWALLYRGYIGIMEKNTETTRMGDFYCSFGSRSPD